MTGVATKRRGYYHFLDAFRQACCPLCHLGRVAVTRYLDLLVYENVNDHVTRDRLRQARGFCSYHSWQFHDEIRDLLAVAIIYADTTNSLAQSLLSTVGSRSRQLLSALGISRQGPVPDRSLGADLTPAACPACEVLDKLTADRMIDLIEYLSEPRFRAAYQASDGLCYPHFVEALGYVQNADDLGVLVGCHDELLARFADGPDASTRDDRRTWVTERARRWRLIENAVGGRGVVGRAAYPPPTADLDGGGTAPDGRSTLLAGNGSCPACEGVRPTMVAEAEAAWRALASGDASKSGQLDHLCNRHAWQVTERVPVRELQPVLAALARRRRSALASADVATSTGARAAARDLGTRLAGHLAVHGACSLCERQVRVEYGVLGALLAPLVRTGRDAPVLCLPHLRQSCHLALPPSARMDLLRRQARDWSALSAELREYIRKQDFRYHGGPWGHERGSPRRAIEHVAGQKDLR